MRTAIGKHLGDFIAIIALFAMALGIGGYILTQQRLRFPIVQDKPKVIKIELANAQAVQPGQGQTVRVAGVEVGKVGKVELEDGIAVVEAQIEEKRYHDLIREDASALLRPKTGVKDMFIEVDPGEGEALDEGERIQLANTAPDIDPDEFYSALDADTRDYLKLLISGAGKGLKGRGNDFREVLKRFEPLHRDLARVTTAIASRRANLRRLITNYGSLTSELGDKDNELTRLVRASNSVFSAMASEEANISRFVAQLPSSLRTTERTLVKVDRFADVLGPTLEDLRPAFRQLDVANREVLPFVREAEPIVRKQIRPFVRAARPYTRDLREAATDLSRATPNLVTSFEELNRLFNIGAFNPRGAEPVSARGRRPSEGYLYWLAWVGQNGVSLFSTSDAVSIFRRVALCAINPQGVQIAVQPFLASQVTPLITDPTPLPGGGTLGGAALGVVSAVLETPVGQAAGNPRICAQ
jgi:phospholipid/cholesterol/gamma-HCH transport system substrate-binding protein